MGWISAGDINNGLATVIGLGSLISERSARSTFPDLVNFRLGHVPNHRRVFSHSAAFFFEQGIANPGTKEFAALSAEYAPGYSFSCSLFEIPEAGLPDLRRREAEYEIENVTYYEEEGGDNSYSSSSSSDIFYQRADSDREEKKGLLCLRSTDETCIRHHGRDHIIGKYGKWGLKTIWGWHEDSGLRPCPAYLRHCVLAAEKLGRDCHDSFLDDTYLVDRKTTIREYLEEYPEVMNAQLPPSLAQRYGG